MDKKFSTADAIHNFTGFNPEPSIFGNLVSPHSRIIRLNEDDLRSVDDRLRAIFTSSIPYDPDESEEDRLKRILKDHRDKVATIRKYLYDISGGEIGAR